MAGHSDGGIAYENKKLNAGAAEEPRRGARSRPRGRPPHELERGDVAASGRRSASKADAARGGRGDARRRRATRVRQTILVLVSRGTASQMEWKT